MMGVRALREATVLILFFDFPEDKSYFLIYFGLLSWWSMCYFVRTLSVSI